MNGKTPNSSSETIYEPLLTSSYLNKNGCAKQRESRTIDRIVGKTLPIGRSVAKPATRTAY